jgi:outer membrane protein assembly factor BamB
MRTALLTLLVAAWPALVLAQTNVPAFLAGREPASADAPTPPEHWSATENVRWKIDVPGLAWSSPIVWGERVFLTTCVNQGESLEPRKGLYLEDLDANKYPRDTSVREWKVICLDLESGRVLWEQLCHSGVPAKPHHLKNTLASETPTTDGERVYAYFGNVGLYCYTLDGEHVWSLPFEAHDTNYGWGTSISPVVHASKVYIVNDNEQSSYLLALDAKTGKEAWRVPREEKTNYSTPFIWVNDVRTEIVVSAIGYARSYDLAGQLLWQIKGRSILAIPTPFERFGNLYLTSGHVAWGENPMYVIRPGASGDLSPSDEKGAALSPHLAWYQPKAGPYHPTPLVVGEQIYVLYDRGLVASFNAKTGAPVYPRKRIPDGRAFTSSPWTYGDKIYCLNEDGVTFAIRTGPEFEVLHTNTLAEEDMCMASPVVVGDKLLIRSAERLYCIAAGAEPEVVGSK